MSPWLVHVVLGSIGLFCAAVLGQVCLWLWRKRPLASYRLVCALLFGALVLPVAQVGMQRWQAPQELELVRRLSPVFGPVFGPVLAPAEAQEMPVSEVDPLAGLTAAELDVLVSVLAEPARSWAPLPTPVAPVETSEPELSIPGLLAAVYLGGLALALVRLGRRLARTRRLLRDAEPVTDPGVLVVWRELVEGSPLRERIELLASPHVQAPVCFGLRRPVIVLPATPHPASFARGPDVLRCVLLHELVHLERRDTWVMLAQEVFHSVFWFHPAAWWLCRKLDALRELSCDLLVVQRTGRRKRYAQALLEYADSMARLRPSPSSTALLPWSGTKSQLSRRIEMLVSLPSQRTFPWTTVPAAVSLVSFLWSGQLAVAAALSPGQDAEPPVPAAAPAAPQEPTWPLPQAAPEPVLAPMPGPARLPQATPHPEPLPGPLLPGVPLLPPELTESPYTQLLPPQQGNTQDPPLLGVWLGDDSPHGIRINQVMQGSLAERHELLAGDVIVEINGEPATREQLERAKKSLRNGSMTLTIVRGGAYRELVVRGDRWPRVEDPAALAYRDLAFEQDAVRKDALNPLQAGQDQIDQARNALEQALRLNPDDAALRRALDSLMTAQDARAAARARLPQARYLKQLELDAAQNAQARGDYEQALRVLKWLENQKGARTYRDPAAGYEQTKPDFWRQVERQQADEETDRRASIEARLRATENELEKRTRELEELKARIHALEAQRGVRGGGGAFGGVRQRTGQTEPTRPVGADIARELDGVRKSKDGSK